jgi:hypothetical protein
MPLAAVALHGRYMRIIVCINQYLTFPVFVVEGKKFSTSPMEGWFIAF